MDPEHLKKSGEFKKLSGEIAEQYQHWHTAVFDDTKSPFDRKTMELMALAVSAAIRCSYCIDSHSQKAKSYGATAEQIAKVIQIASVVSAGSTISYGLEALDTQHKK